MKNKGKKAARGFDINSFLGLIIAMVLMVIGIILTKSTDEATGEAVYIINWASLLNFWDPTSVFIVVGGTFASLMIAFPVSQFAKIPKHMGIIFSPKKYTPESYIEQIVTCAKKARINGLLALEEDVNQMTNAFLKSSLMMVVDSVDPDKLNEQLEASLENLDERHGQDCSFYDKGAALAPAFGMIGTLIGLINMLKDLQDIESIGPNMAVALITTLYGSMLANILFMPIANKLRMRHEEEYLCMKIVSEGVKGIQAGENPNFIEERLLKSSRYDIAGLPVLQSDDLPMSASSSAVVAGTHCSVSLSLVPVAAKLGLKVEAAERNGFHLKSIRIVNLAAEYSPFSDAYKARTMLPEDFSASQEEISAVSAGKIIYVPVLENCQGELFPGNTDSRNKTPDRLSSDTSLLSVT